MHFLDWRGMICFLFRVPLGKPLENTNNPWEDVNKEITQIDKHCEWTWKNSWPFPQFTTSVNKGEAWESSAYILPTSNIDKDPLFLNLKKLSPLQKAMSLIWVSGIHCLQKLSWLIAPEKLCIFSNPYLSQIGIVSSGLYLSTSWPRTKKPSAEERRQRNITSSRRRRGRHLNGNVCRLWIPAGSPWMDPPVLGSVPFSTSCPFT